MLAMLTPDAVTDAIILAISPETAGLQENGLVQGHPTRGEGHSPERVMFLPCSRYYGVGAKSLSSSILDALLDDSEEEEIRRMRLDYNGSRSRYAQVEVQGVPAQGIVDSGADITIIGGELFRSVAAVARLRKDLKKPDRVPRTYDHRPFTLDGRMDHLSFDGTTMRIPVYIKMDT